MYCRKFGSKIPDDSDFCFRCGSPTTGMIIICPLAASMQGRQHHSPNPQWTRTAPVPPNPEQAQAAPFQYVTQQQTPTASVQPDLRQRVQSNPF